MAVRSYKLIPTSVFVKSDLNSGDLQQPKRSLRSIIENNLENTSFTPSTHHVAEQKIPQEGVVVVVGKIPKIPFSTQS